MLGYTAEEWGVINGFANWLAAIGTISAVVVSLVLARASGRGKGKVSAGKRKLRDPDSPSDVYELIAIRLVNIGDRPIHVMAAGWRIGRWGKHSHFMQVFNPGVSSKLPLRLDHGEDGIWCTPENAKSGNWYEHVAKMLKDAGDASPSSLRAVVVTSTGQEFLCRPDAELVNSIEKACKNLRS